MGLGVWGDQAEAEAVGGAVGDAGVGVAFGDLPFGGVDGVGAFAVGFIFPADDFGFGKETAESGDDLGGGSELDQEFTAPGGNLPGRFEGHQFAGADAHEDFAEAEITDGGGVEEGVHFGLRQQL